MFRLPRRGRATVVAGALFALGAHAEPATPCAQPTALGRLACELAATTPPLEDALVVSGPLQGAPEASDLVGLSQRLSSAVAAALHVADGGTANERAEASQRARRARHLVWLHPKLTGSRLGVTLEVLPNRGSFWQRLKPTGIAPSHHTFAEQRLDPEIRSYFPVVPLVVTQVHRAALPFPAPSKALSIACGDLDADGALELAVAGRQHVVLGRVRRGKLERSSGVSWSDLSPVAPVPLREPLVTSHLRAGRALELGSSDRSSWTALDPELRPTARARGLQPWPGLGCAKRQGLGFAPRVLDCTTETPLDLPAPSDRELDTLAGLRFTRRDGTAAVVVGARGLGEDQVSLIDDRGRRAVVPHAGAQLAFGDLDLDGKPEIAVSLNTLEPTEDTLRVFTWDPPKLQARFELPVPNGIDALAVCPSERHGLAPLVVATGNELWVIE